MMKRALRFLAVFLVLVGAAGCGENHHLLTHDLVVFWNEVCDNMLRATDDESAKDLLKVQFKLLEKRQDTLRKRAENRAKEIDKADATDLEDALVDYYYEILATEKRLAKCQDILNGIIAATPSHQHLEQVRDWPTSKREFDKIYIGKYQPTEKDQPKQFGTGLVLKRPNFDFSKKGTITQ
jgi:hypothetical protein